jgi:hypothetical protein
MSDEELPPTHQPWGAKRPPDSSSSPPPPPPPPPPRQDPDTPYGAPPNPYPQPGSFDQYAAPTPYSASPYGAYPGTSGGLAPDHPSATTGLVLGIVGLVGIMTCAGVTLVLSPFAWAISSRVLREIEASPGRYSGREKASAGRIMGMIGTVLLVLGVIALAGIILLAFAIGPTTTHIGPSHPVVHHHGVVNS